MKFSRPIFVFTIPLICHFILAQSPDADTGPTSPLSPHHYIDIPGIEEVTAIVPAGVGSRLYVEAKVTEINLWALAVYYWPEAVAVLFSLIIVWASRRLIRRSGEEPRCGNCGYILIGLAQAGIDRCPECGTRIMTAHYMGEARRSRRKLTALGLLGAVFVAYFSLNSFVPRAMGVSNLFNWPSARVGTSQFVRSRVEFTPLITRRNASFLVDVNRPEKVEVLCPSIGARAADAHPICAAPDGGWMLARCETSCIQFDGRSGKEIRAVADGASRSFMWVPEKTDGKRLWGVDETGALFEWDPSIGKSQIHVQLESLTPKGWVYLTPGENQIAITGALSSDQIGTIQRGIWNMSTGKLLSKTTLAMTSYSSMFDSEEAQFRIQYRSTGGWPWTVYRLSDGKSVGSLDGEFPPRFTGDGQWIVTRDVRQRSRIAVYQVK